MGRACDGRMHRCLDARSGAGLSLATFSCLFFLLIPPSSPSPDSPPPPNLPFESALAQIEQIIERIESGEVGLEQSLAEYERGVTLINHCRTKLDAARGQVEDLTHKLQQADDGSASGAGGEADADDPDHAESSDE